VALGALGRGQGVVLARLLPARLGGGRDRSDCRRLDPLASASAKARPSSVRPRPGSGFSGWFGRRSPRRRHIVVKSRGGRRAHRPRLRDGIMSLPKLALGGSPLTDPRALGGSAVFHALLLLVASAAALTVMLPKEPPAEPTAMHGDLGPVDNRAPEG